VFKFTIAAAVFPLAHVPPAGVQFNVVVAFLQIVREPVVVTVPGKAITVTTALAAQLVLKVYEIVAVPAVAPPRTPTELSAIVTFPLLLDHVPPAGVLFRVVVAPAQMLSAPVKAVGV